MTRVVIDADRRGGDRPSIHLVENGPPVETVLTAGQVSVLRDSDLVTLTPSFTPNRWNVAPRRFVGVARIGQTQVWVQAKLPIRRLIFLLGYAYDLSGWRDGQVEVAQDEQLLPAIATAYARQAARAVEQGLIQGYRVREEAVPVLRGRIRTDEQLRRRFGLPVPLVVRYDDYTVDIDENRILRTAAERLLRIPRLPSVTRHALLRLVRLMIDVPPLGRGMPIPRWQPTRLNARYHPALGLAELVLRGGSIEHGAGHIVVDGFMLDMARLFEQFLTVALCEALAPLGGRLVGQARYHLDEEREIAIKPDIVWHATRSGPPTLVADAKYKAEQPSGYPNADAYQILAYCLRLGLNEGHLVYAKGEAEPGRHHVVNTPVTIVRHALDLDLTPNDLLGQIDQLAAQFNPAERGLLNRTTAQNALQT